MRFPWFTGFLVDFVELSSCACAADPMVRTNIASLKEFPEGPGLAIAFPGDAGIRTEARVIFTDNFESGDLGTGWDETGNPHGEVLRFAPPGGDMQFLWGDQ